MKKLNRYSWIAIVTAGLLTGGVAGAAPQKTADFINVETPFRCSVQKAGDMDVLTTVAIGADDFQLTRFDPMDVLPRYEVNGLSFKKQPIDEALQQLLEEADITVYSEDGFYPTMDADQVYGELTDVVNGLTEAGDIFYRYDARQKEMYLSRRERFELKLPDNRMIMLAMLDALRGADIDNLQPDWKANTILMSLTRSEKETVEKLASFILQDGYLLLADTQVFTTKPRGEKADWQKVANRFGTRRIYQANNGLYGQLLTVGNQVPRQTLLRTVGSEFDLTPVTQGVAIVPNGWKMRFNVGRCAVKSPLASLSVLLNARVLSPEKVVTKLTLDSRMGEISSFDTVTAIDDELIVIGVPSPVESSEDLMMTVKLRLIRLIKEK